MVQLKVGDKVSLEDKRTGTNDKGNTWMMFHVKAEKGYDRITVWVRNADFAKNLTEAEIESIESVAIKNTMKNDKWYTDYTVNVRLKSAAYEAQMNAQAAQSFESALGGFMTVPDNLEDESLPFN